MTIEPRRIESAANPLLVRLRRLAGDPAAYRRLGEILLEGDHLCAAWLERGGAVASAAIISEAGWDEPALRNLARQASRVAIVAPALLAASSGLESPPRIVFVVPWRGAGVLQPAAPSLVLDRLQVLLRGGSLELFLDLGAALSEAGNHRTVPLQRCGVAVGVFQHHR